MISYTVPLRLQLPLLIRGHIWQRSGLLNTHDGVSRSRDLQNICFNVVPGVKIGLTSMLLLLI